MVIPKRKCPFLNLDFLVFDEKEHKYTNTKFPELEYTSVTGFLSSKSAAFNEFEVSASLEKNQNSAYNGLSQEEIRSEWENIRNKGTFLHAQVEDYIDSLGKAMPHIGESLKQCPEFSPYLEKMESMWSEIRVLSDVLRIAGTADILTYDRHLDEFRVFDIKTYRNINPDKIYSASMQISLYCLMLKALGLQNVKVGGILWFENYSQRPHVIPKFVKCIPCMNILNPMLKDRILELKS
jgi:hypothetical protein